MAGIYIHIPFCKQACYYCDFHFSTSLKKKDDLVNALQKELILRKTELEDQPINTIYFGGGTPSLLSVAELEVLIKTVYSNYQVGLDPEITLEANPDDLIGSSTKNSAALLKSYRDIGINRLSIGIQSFFDDDLKSMNRAHNAKEARACLNMAKKYFDNITIDLIYGIPNMSLEKWDENLQIAFGLNIPHISSYALTIEPKTALDNFIKKGTYPAINEELALMHFKRLVEQTKKNGYVHYEISSFGKPKYFSRHNTSYWKGENYIGIGPSAHSFNGDQRSWNIANNTKYLKAIADNTLPQQRETLSTRDKYNEYVMTGLRTIWGVAIARLEEEFGTQLKEHFLESAQSFLDRELLSFSEDMKSVIVTMEGKFLVDGIASELFMI